MFTGIVQAIGVVLRAGPGSFEVSLPVSLEGSLAVGGSIAVDGVCLTARSVQRDSFAADISSETAARTTLGSMRVGSAANLELAVSVNRALGGHWVLGHVDAVGKVSGLFREKEGWSLIVSFPPKFARYVAEKGSVAVDGVSLTPFAVTGDSFHCALIPETYEATAFHERRAGDSVNLEFDILAKYVERMIAHVSKH
ncbi:MAG: riboflavin synthase [Candidatus Bipolaricaulis sp.]|nr:riboflavin synthase [Candidatus Bipolaricaulis sp.]